MCAKMIIIVLILTFKLLPEQVEIHFRKLSPDQNYAGPQY